MPKLSLLLVALLVLGTAAPPAAGAGKVELLDAPVNLSDRASLQRGARLFMNYCASCHSAGLLRYSRMAQDLGLSEAEVMTNLNFTGAKFGDPIEVAMDPADAQAWLGAAPPDLSLTARGKHGGPDWVYTYLKSFYIDESRPIGWNNTVLPGASMPHVLWELQGIQYPVYEQDPATGQPRVVGFRLRAGDEAKAAAYDEVARDLTNFMHYMAEPAALERAAWGPWVILYLVFFTFMMWILKQEYWRDVH